MNNVEEQLYGAFHRMEQKMKTVVFEVNYTKATAVVTHTLAGSKSKPRKKLFRMGYADRTCKVDQWIHSQIDSYREMALTDGFAIQQFQIIGHKLSVKRPGIREILDAMKQLLKEVEEITDVSDINSSIGIACKRADDILERSR